MERKAISAYLGGIVDLVDIGKNEPRKFYFETESELSGTFDFKLWNSDKKNDVIPTSGTPVFRVNNKLTLTFDAAAWSVPPGKYYYEIIKNEDKQIYFKGEPFVID